MPSNTNQLESIDVTTHTHYSYAITIAECLQIQFWKTMEGPSTVKEHVIVYEERKDCLTPLSASATRTVRGVRMAGHVYNLWPATTVSARVVAVNGNYEGLPSVTVTFRTKEGGQYSTAGRRFSVALALWSRSAKLLYTSSLVSTGMADRLGV